MVVIEMATADGTIFHPEKSLERVVIGGIDRGAKGMVAKFCHYSKIGVVRFLSCGQRKQQHQCKSDNLFLACFSFHSPRPDRDFRRVCGREKTIST